MTPRLGISVQPLGDRAALVLLAHQNQHPAFEAVHLAAHALEQARIPGVIEWVPAFTSLSVYYDPTQIEFAELQRRLIDCIARPHPSSATVGRSIDIPVCYVAELGPDLPDVARHCQIDPDEVVRRHYSAAYKVQMIGFSPGFPYLTGLPQELATPRRATPRSRVAAGSVGIAGAQSGIYPSATPGGWQLIGRTPLRLFDPDLSPPSLLRPGDNVRFVPIDRQEFQEWSE